MPFSVPEDCSIAIAAAKRALEGTNGTDGWNQMNLKKRLVMISTLTDLIERDRDHLKVLEAVDSGVPYTSNNVVSKQLELAAVSDVSEALSVMRFHLANASQVEFPNNGSCVLDPVGVIAAIISWKAPLSTLAEIMTPALIYGNTLVIKVSETSPLTALHVASLVTASGLPKGVVNFITGENL